MNNKKVTYIAILLFLVGITSLYLGTSISFALDYTEKNSFENFNREENLHVESPNDTSNEKIKLSFIGDSLIGSFKGENIKGNFRDLCEIRRTIKLEEYCNFIFNEK